MTAEHVPVRVRSGLSLPLHDDWTIVDAIEARGPEGIIVSAASYPVSVDCDLVDVAASDVVTGAEAVGAPRSAFLFGGRDGLVQRFDSTESTNGFTQLVGYAHHGTRLLIARATCPRERFDELEEAMRVLLADAAVEASTVAAPALVTEAADVPKMAAYLSGASLLELPPRQPPADVAVLTAAWEQSTAPAFAEPISPPAVLTAAELGAAARLYGQSVYPGVARPAGPSAAAIESLARSVLMARGLVRFTSPNDFLVDESLARIVRLALQADFVAQVTMKGRTSRRFSYFIGADGALQLSAYPGDLYACRHVDPDTVFADLLARTGELPDDGDGSDVIGPSDEQLDRQGAVRITIRRALAADGRIEIDTLSLVSIEQTGCYARDPSGSWVRASAADQRRRLLETLTG